jgi:hypothetical protein
VKRFRCECRGEQVQRLKYWGVELQRCRGTEVKRCRGEEEGRGEDEVAQVQSFRGVEV